MAIKITSGLASHLLVTGSAKNALDGCEIRFYSGTEGSEPATAGAAATGTALWTITKDGDGVTGLTWSATPSINEGVSVSMVKTPSEVWSGDTSAGVVRYFRIVEMADADDADNTALRAQGIVGMNTTYDFYMSNTTLTTNASPTAKVLSDFTFGLPIV